MHSTEFSRIVQNFAAIASDVHIEVDKTGASFWVRNRKTYDSVYLPEGTGTGEGKGDLQSPITLQVIRPVTSLYPLRYLAMFCKSATVSDRVELRMSAGLPLLVSTYSRPTLL